jgi:T-complex protein 1 subunit theta
MGDATNLVLILAGELLKRAEHLLVMGLHPSEVVIGYEMAVEKGRQELECSYKRNQGFITVNTLIPS